MYGGSRWTGRQSQAGSTQTVGSNGAGTQTLGTGSGTGTTIVGLPEGDGDGDGAGVAGDELESSSGGVLPELASGLVVLAGAGAGWPPPLYVPLEPLCPLAVVCVGLCFWGAVVGVGRVSTGGPSAVSTGPLGTWVGSIRPLPSSTVARAWTVSTRAAS